MFPFWRCPCGELVGSHGIGPSTVASRFAHDTAPSVNDTERYFTAEAE